MAETTLMYNTMSASNGFRNPPSGSEGRVGFGNLAKDYAALNRKNMRHTDNKGYPLCYVVEVEAIGSTANNHTIELFTAPETWVLKNAVRKWHIARNAMLERVGALGRIGEYQKTIRPYLNGAHYAIGTDIRPTGFLHNPGTSYSGGTPDPGDGGSTYRESGIGFTGSGMNRGEWTYTEIAAAVDQEVGSSTSNDTDRYHLTLTGEHSASIGSSTSGAGSDSGQARYFTTVSMLRSYLESRRNASSVVQDTSGGGTIQAEPNPLVNLMSDRLSVGEVKEIVQDMQREKPPYDAFGTNSADAADNNDAFDLVSKCLLSTSTTYLKDKEVIRIPMGLFHVRTSATAAIGSTSDTPSMRIRLLGIDKCQG